MPVRILFLHRNLPPDSFTGVAIQVHRLANALTDLGQDISVFTHTENPPDARYRVLPIGIAGVPFQKSILRYQSWGKWGKFGKRFLLPLLYRHLNMEGYDIIHVHGDGGFLRFGRNFVRTFYGTADLESRHAQHWKARIAQTLSYQLEKREDRLCAIGVGISPHVRDYLPNVRVCIPCMLPSPPLSHSAEKTSEPSLLFIGSISSRKNGGWAIGIYVRLRRQFPNLRLHYVGPEHERTRVRELTHAEGKPGDEDGLVFHSKLPQEKLSGLYRRSWIYLCLSSYEGFGVCIIEAMANGCLAASTSHPGSRALIRDGQNGLLVAPDCAVERIGFALEDGELRARLQKNGLEYAERFSPEKIARSYLDVYRRIYVGLHSGGAYRRPGTACH